MEEEEEPAVWARRGAQRRSISRYSRQILFIASQRRHKKGECRLTAPFSFSRKGRPYQAALIKDPFTCPSLLFPLPPSPKYERKVETRRSKKRKYLDRKNDDGRGKKGRRPPFPFSSLVNRCFSLFSFFLLLCGDTHAGASSLSSSSSPPGVKASSFSSLFFCKEVCISSAKEVLSGWSPSPDPPPGLLSRRRPPSASRPGAYQVDPVLILLHPPLSSPFACIPKKR